MISALYLHIPFCDHICAYCDFPKVLGRFFDKSLYIERLIEEIESLKIQDGSLKTIYIGGGTPSSLSEEELERLLSYLKKRFPNLDEFTIEANPESLDERKLSIMKRNGIDRISLGAESGNDAILAKMGRAHSRKDIVLAVERTRAQGIENINLDFIYGYPGESLPDALDDVSFAVGLKEGDLDAEVCGGAFDAADEGGVIRLAVEVGLADAEHVDVRTVDDRNFHRTSPG